MRPYIVIPHRWVTILTATLTTSLVILKALGLLGSLPWLLVFWPAMAVIIFCVVLSVANYVSVTVEVRSTHFYQWLKANKYV